ncbi:FAD-dependent oxidoreductase [Sorangium sp. So ce1097]|uniref:FAD-dependent oxidoreductase n=1 Tax=Sorangium sp. So ce1097 TaxID=3133330 RepID=UPI003F642C46
MTVPAERGLYVLGSFEGRVTIYSQQIRALNLIHALWTTGALTEDRRLAVIGGGIAGITAALGAACKNIDVTLYERQPEVLHLMRGCHTRWVHPTIYDWPRGEALAPRERLPFLHWEAASAGDVAATLAEDWNHLKSVLPIKEVTGATVTLGPWSDGRRRVFTTSPGFSEDEHHVVILAVGFGVERSIAPHPLRSYWRDDALHQPEIGASHRPVHSLVSGNGDGGLIDVLRLRLREFKHGTLLNELVSVMDSDRLRDVLEQIEQEAWNRHIRGEDYGGHLYRSYQRLKDMKLVDAVDDRIRKRLRSDTRVTFNFPDWPFTIFSSVLNRFLVSRLLVVDSGLDTLIGRVVGVEGVEPDLVVHMTNPMGAHAVRFQRVIIRHGPTSALETGFPALHERMRPILEARNALDQTRIRCWPDGFFPLPAPMGEPAPPAATGADASGPPSGTPGAPPPASGDRPPAASSSAATETVTAAPSDMAAVAAPMAPETTGAIHHPAAVPERVRPEARELRDQILHGQQRALSAKLGALTEAERRFIVRSVALKALEESEDGLVGFGLLLRQCMEDQRSLDRPALLQMLVEIVRRAAFSSSINTKALVLDYPPEMLANVDGDALSLFFEDVFDIVLRDQFGEVNTLVPRLVRAETAIPESLYERYFKTLLEQTRSRSRQGAPAAKRAIDRMPENIAKFALRALDYESLTSVGHQEIMKKFVAQHIGLAEDAKRPLFDDFLSLSWREFIEKYEPQDDNDK